MNTAITSKEAILKNCRLIVSKQGLSSLNMRLVAQTCQVALGALYYYFPSKNDLLMATIESVWDDIFFCQDIKNINLSFIDYINNLFINVQSRIKKYPHFFTIHSISISAKNQNEAHNIMKKYLNKLKQNMLISLQNDHNINSKLFNENFKKEDFIDFVLDNFICLLIHNKHDCNFLLKIMKNILY